jgi:hypothetical protein
MLRFVPPRTIEFAFGDVLVESATPHTDGDRFGWATHWPCPGCDVRQSTRGRWQLLATDAGGRHRRQFVVCASCALNVIAARADDSTGGALAGSDQRTGEGQHLSKTTAL